MWIILGLATWVLGVAGMLGGLLWRRAARKRMDTMIRMGGYTVEQVRIVRKAVIFRGHLPDEPELRDIAFVFATQSARNIPLGWPPRALYLAGLTLTVSFAYNISGLLPAVVAFQVLVLAFGAYTVFINVRGIRYAERVAALAPESADSAPTVESAGTGAN